LGEAYDSRKKVIFKIIILFDDENTATSLVWSKNIYNFYTAISQVLTQKLFFQ